MRRAARARGDPKSLFLHFARHLGVLKGRHAGVAGHRRLDHSEGQSGAGTFAKPQSEVKQGGLAKPPQHLFMSALRRDMARDAMVECGFIQRVENGGGGADHIAIENHRNAFHARR